MLFNVQFPTINSVSLFPPIKCQPLVFLRDFCTGFAVAKMEPSMFTAGQVGDKDILLVTKKCFRDLQQTLKTDGE